LKELHDLAGVAVDGAVRLVVDDEIEVERREFLAIPGIHHQRLDRGDDDRGTEQLACTPRRFVDDRPEFAENDVETIPA